MAFLFWSLPTSVPEGPVGNLTFESISSTAIHVSWEPPSQPNGLVFYYLSLNLQQSPPRHMIPPLVTYENSIDFDDLEKYTDYIFKITPSTEKGFSETYTTQLHIKTEEDGRKDPAIAYYMDYFCTIVLCLYAFKNQYLWLFSQVIIFPRDIVSSKWLKIKATHKIKSNYIWSVFFTNGNLFLSH